MSNKPNNHRYGPNSRKSRHKRYRARQLTGNDGFTIMSPDGITIGQLAHVLPEHVFKGVLEDIHNNPGFTLCQCSDPHIYVHTEDGRELPAYAHIGGDVDDGKDPSSNADSVVVIISGVDEEIIEEWQRWGLRFQEASPGNSPRIMLDTDD